MKIAKDRTEEFLRGIAFFSQLQKSAVENLLKAVTLRSYEKNQTIFLRGDKADRFFIIINGWIKLSRETPEGDETIVALLTRGDVFGEAALFSTTNYSFSATAAENSQLAQIPATTIKEVAKSNPDILQRIMATMSREIYQIQMEREHLALMSAAQRVGCLILQLSENMSGKGGVFTFPYDKSLAAQRLGMNPETFSRALAQLKPVGVSVKGSEIRIDSFERLAEFSCVHCSSLTDECAGKHRIPSL